jgi:hypothetical protein
MPLQISFPSPSPWWSNGRTAGAGLIGRALRQHEKTPAVLLPGYG